MLLGELRTHSHWSWASLQHVRDSTNSFLRSLEKGC